MYRIQYYYCYYIFNHMSLCLPLLPSSYQICEFLYEREHLYDRIIDCYLRDPLRKVTLVSDLSNYACIRLMCAFVCMFICV